MGTSRNPSVVCPKLIGRKTELASLADLITQAGRGQGQIALIAGEAGIGKSRLVAEIRAIAVQGGANVVQGRCFEQDRGFPYAPLLDLLRTFCTGRSETELARVLCATASELVKLLPELATLLPNLMPAPVDEPEQEKRRLFQALTQFLRQLATKSSQPLLVIFEDLHWADDTSLEWLLYLARYLGTQPLFVLLTYRQNESPLSLQQLLAALDRMSFVNEFVLAPLTRADVDAMLQAIFKLSSSPRAEFLDALYELTEGNPFFLEEVLKSLIAAGDLYQVSGEWTRKPVRELQIPRTVQVAVQQRTRQLSLAAQRLLTLAAVAGQRFDFTVLQAVTQQAESELLEQVRELIAAQLVIEESDETFAFRHALTRQAIYTALLGRERKALHRALTEAMAHCYSDSLDLYASELAHHFYEAGVWASALVWAQRAGDQAERIYAYGEALSHHLRARECAEKLGRPDQVTAQDRAIGRAHYARNQFLQAIEFYDRALQATTDPAERAALKAQIGAAYANIADERSQAFLHAALRELDPVTQTRLVALATLWLGRHYHYLGRYTQALPCLEQARQLSEQLDDTPLLRYVYASLANTLMLSAHFERSVVWAHQCVALGKAKQYLPALVVGYYNLSTHAQYVGRWRDARAFADQGLRLSSQPGWRTEETWLTLCYACAVYQQDNLALGVQSARAGVALAAELGERRSLVRAYEILALFETALGNEEAAYAGGEAAMRAADTLMEVNLRCWSRMALAGLHMQREEWGQAVELYEQCAVLLADTENRIIRIELGTPLAAAYCVRGQLGRAEQLIAETLTETQATGMRHNEAVAWRVQGQICAAQGQLDEALAAFDQAIALCTELGSRLELAQALYQRGVLHRTQHDLVSAQTDWAQARQLCEQMGARALLWRIHAANGQAALAQRNEAEAEAAFEAGRAIIEELAAAMHDESFRQHLRQRAATLIPARRPLAAARRAKREEMGGLTERQVAIAVLIAQGKSNREIAEALVISERTVTTHISNIFNKLGYTSRTQIATWAGETGLIHHSSCAA